jgi:tetratricopeptide (TPR) repeat protein
LLISPANNCANFYLDLVAKNEQNERIIAIMKRNLVAALQEDGNKLLEICFKIGALGGETSQSLVTKDSLKLMIQYFDKTIELLKGNYLEKRIEARKDFLEMLLITYDKGSLYEGKKISSAISKLKKSLEKEPDVFYTLTALGHLYGTRQILDSCIYYYKKCLELDPHFLVANDIIANQYFIKGDMNNARKYFEYHNTERPNSSFGYEGIAKTYQVDGDKTKAFNFFNQAYEKEKVNAQIMKGILENSLSNEVRQKKFRRFLTEINNLNTDNKQKDFKRFELYWAMRDTTKAREIAYKYIFANKIYLNDTTRRKTNDLSFSDNSFFSDFFRAVKDCKGFEAIMKNSSIDNPKDANSFQLLGRNYLLYCNEPEKAEKAFLKSYELDSLNFSTSFGLSDFYSQQIDIDKRRNLDKAIYFGEKALKIYDSEFLVYNALAPLYSEKGNFKKAIYFYKKGISLEKNVKNGVYDIQKLLAQHYSLLSDCYDQLSMLDSAIYFVKEGLNLNPKDIMLYQTLANYHFNQKAYQEAFNVVKYAYDKIDSTNKTLLGSLGLYCYVLDRFKESNYYYSQMEKYLDKGFRLPNGIMIDNVSPTYLTFMSNNYAYLNNLSKAEEIANKYIQLNPNEIGGYSALALAYRKSGKIDEAKALSDKMFGINNKDFRGFSNLAKIYAQTKEFDKALEWTEKALQNGMTRPVDYERLLKTDDEWAGLRSNQIFINLINTYFKKK